MENEELRLVLNAINGDHESYNSLSKQYGPILLGLIYTFVRDIEVAKDLTQETLLKAFTSLPSIQHPEKFASWVKQIAVNLAKSQLRKKGAKYTLSTEGQDLESYFIDSNTVEVQFEKQVEKEEINRLIAELPLGLQRALKLHYLVGLSPAEAADKLGISRAAFDTRLSRGRDLIKHKLTLPIVQKPTDSLTQAKEIYLNSLADRVKQALLKEKVERIVAAKELALLAARANLNRLYHDLNSHSDSNRLKAVRLLANTFDNRAEDQLILALTAEEVPVIQANICRALSCLGGIKAVSHLREKAKHTADVTVHKAAIDAIKIIESYSSENNQQDIPISIEDFKRAGIIEIFLEMLQDQTNIRINAVDGLGRVEAVQAIPNIIQLYRVEQEASVKIVIVEALGAILYEKRSSNQKITKKVADEVITLLGKALQEEHQGIMAEAARALAYIPFVENSKQGEYVKTKLMMSLKRALHRPGPWWVTFPLLFERFKDKLLLDELIHLLRDKETKYTRPLSLAIEAMLGPEHEEFIPTLIKVIEEDIEQGILIRALARTKSARMLPFIKECLNKNRFTKTELVHELVRAIIQVPNGKEFLKELILNWCNREEYFQENLRSAITTLTSIGTGEDVGFLNNLVQTANLSKRSSNLARMGALKLANR